MAMRHWFLAPLFFLVSITLFASPVTAQAEVNLLSNADVLISDSKTPPTEQAAWQKTTLPYFVGDLKMSERPESVWFRFDKTKFALDSAIFLNRYMASVNLYIGTQHIGGNEIKSSGSSVFWNTPLYLVLPNKLLSNDAKYLYIRLQTDRFGPFLLAPVLGSQSQVFKLWQEKSFWQLETSRGAFLLCVLLSLIALALCLSRPGDTLYLKMLGASTCWGLVCSYFFYNYFPLPLPLLIIVVHGLIDFALLLLFMFVNQALALGARRVEKVFIAVVTLSLLINIFNQTSDFLIVMYLFHFIGMSFLVYIFLRSLFVSSLETRVPSYWISLAFIGLVILGLHDMYNLVILDLDERDNAMGLSHLSVLFILLCFSAHLVQRFVLTLNEVRQLNDELEDRVQKKHQQLESAFAENLHLEAQRLNLEQKHHIYRDLHDDVGAKLVSIIQSATNHSGRSLAKSALENLRAAIYRSKNPDQSINQLLEALHDEADLRASAMQIDLRWRQPLVKGEVKFLSETNYHITRIFREALTNSLVAAQVSTVEVVIAHQADCLTIKVGNQVSADLAAVGLDGALNGAAGNGLDNIRYRADLVGARVSWYLKADFMWFELRLSLSNSE